MASIDNVNDKQLVAGYLRGKPRSRSMHAATIKEHIKCTGYCRRDPYRQLLVSCCQPRRWTSRTYFYTGCFASNRFSKLTLNLRFFVRLVNILISYIFASYSIKLIFISYFEDSYTVILYREISIVSNRDFNFWGTTEISAHIHFTISKSVHKVSIFTKHFHYEVLQTIHYKYEWRRNL